MISELAKHAAQLKPIDYPPRYTSECLREESGGRGLLTETNHTNLLPEELSHILYYEFHTYVSICNNMFRCEPSEQVQWLRNSSD